MTPFSTLLRRHRQARRVSQGRLAETAKLDHSLVSRLESGDRNPTAHSIYQLTEALGLPEADEDALWLAAGLVPPDIDAQLLGRLIAFIREAQATTATERAHSPDRGRSPCGPTPRCLGGGEMTEMMLSWFNYKTGEYEFRAGAPETDEEAVQYLPQERTARLHYDCNRKLGLSVLEAMEDTLRACIGEPRR